MRNRQPNGMRTFSGFTSGKVRSVGLPEPVFTELIPEIDDLWELKVTLHVLWRLGRQQGKVRYVQHNDLLADQILLAGLAERPREALEAGLARAVERGTLLLVQDDAAGSEQRLYFANTPLGRAAVAAIEGGEWPQELEPADRPNVFTLYEQNIGMLTPLIADELREAEQTYPAAWIEEAFREAVALNKRSWRYARAILERWRTEGRGEEAGRRSAEESRRRYIQGEYGDYIDH